MVEASGWVSIKEIRSIVHGMLLVASGSSCAVCF
jgi:hypothetical protein